MADLGVVVCGSDISKDSILDIISFNEGLDDVGMVAVLSIEVVMFIDSAVEN